MADRRATMTLRTRAMAAARATAGGHVKQRPEPRGKRYRLRGLIAMTIAGLASWALIIWLVWLLVRLFT